MKQLYTLVCLFLIGEAIMAQSNTTAPGSGNGQNKFTVLGNAEMTFYADKDETQFGDVNFKPIFLWRISDRLFMESEVEIETGDGAPDIGLEYANMCYFVNKYLTLHAGRFLPKFGAYRGRFGEGFINRMATDPVGFGDGGIGTMNEVGVGAQGGFGIGNIKLSYDLYVSNGPQLLTDPENAGQFEYESYIGNNKGKALGGRIAILPFSNSSLEIAYSFLEKSKTGDAGTPYENIGVAMQDVDLNFFHSIPSLETTVRVIGEWKYQKVDNATYYKEDSSTYTFGNTPSAFYMLGAIRPSQLHNKFLRNIEVAARYSRFNRPADAPWGGDISQKAFSLDYWLKWNSLLKFTYQTETGVANALYAQVIFGF